MNFDLYLGDDSFWMTVRDCSTNEMKSYVEEAGVMELGHEYKWKQDGSKYTLVSDDGNIAVTAIEITEQ